jgi:hypothetical protein
VRHNTQNKKNRANQGINHSKSHLPTIDVLRSTTEIHIIVRSSQTKYCEFEFCKVALWHSKIARIVFQWGYKPLGAFGGDTVCRLCFRWCFGWCLSLFGWGNLIFMWCSIHSTIIICRTFLLFVRNEEVWIQNKNCAHITSYDPYIVREMSL